MLYFSYKMRLVSAKGNLSCAAGCGLTGSWWDHAPSFSDRPRIVNELFSANFSHVLHGLFAWQAQYLVRLDNDTCCSALCK